MSAQYFLWRDGSEVGPFSPDEMRQMIAAGSIHANTLMRAGATRDWDTLRNYFHELQEPASPPPQPEPEPEPQAAEPVEVRVASGWETSGGWLIGFGALIALFFLFGYDVSVPNGSEGRVINIGKLNDRTLGTACGLAIWLSGFLCIIVSRLTLRAFPVQTAKPGSREAAR